MLMWYFYMTNMSFLKWLYDCRAAGAIALWVQAIGSTLPHGNQPLINWWYMGVSIKWMFFSGKSDLKMYDDWGYPYLRNHPFFLTPWSLPLGTWLAQIGVNNGTSDQLLTNGFKPTMYIHVSSHNGFPHSHQLIKSCFIATCYLGETTQLH